MFCFADLLYCYIYIGTQLYVSFASLVRARAWSKIADAENLQSLVLLGGLACLPFQGLRQVIMVQGLGFRVMPIIFTLTPAGCSP